MSLLNQLRKKLRLWGLNPALVLVLAIGGFAPIASRVFGTSIDAYLIENARRLLTADMAVTASRPFKKQDFEALTQNYPAVGQADEVEFVSVIRSPDGSASALLELHAVGDGFPLSGAVTDVDGANLERVEHTKRPQSPFEAWVTRDAAELLNLSQSEKIRLGAREFSVARVIESAPGQSRASFGFAPKVIFRLEDVAATGLVGPGSIAYYRRYFDFGAKKPQSSEEIKRLLPSDELSARTPNDSIRGFERAAEAILIFLGVVSLLQLSMGATASYAVSAIDRARVLKVAALESVFGASTQRVRWRIIGVFALNVGLGVTFAVLLAWVLLWVVQPFVDRLMQKAVPGVPFEIALTAWDGPALFVFVALGTYLLAAPVFRSIQSRGHLKSLIGVSDLISNSESVPTKLGWGTRLKALLRAWGLPSVVAALCLFGAGIGILQSFTSGAAVVAGLAVLSALLWSLASPVLAFLGGILSAFNRGGAQLVSQLLRRPRLSSKLTFVVIGFSSFLTTSLVAVGVRMTSEFSPPDQTSIPDYFAFNIPDSELKDVGLFFAEQGAVFSNPSPLIMARLLKRNGLPFPESPDTDRITRFPVRVTWREELSQSESLVEGKTFADLRTGDRAADAPPMVSLEIRFAKQIGVKLGDLLTFDVQGIQFDAEVVSFRSVKWIEFQPNFFISFEQGVLDDAPKTWLGTISQRQVNQKLVTEAQNRFTGISLLNVKDALRRILGLLGALSVPIRVGLVFSIAVAFTLLIVSILISSRIRSIEIALMSVFGASPRFVALLLRCEYGLVGSVSGLFGATLGLLAAAGAGRFLFSWGIEFDLGVALVSAASGGMAGLFLGELIGRSLRPQLGKSTRLV